MLFVAIVPVLNLICWSKPTKAFIYLFIYYSLLNDAVSSSQW
jgi:hypothetical protein